METLMTEENKKARDIVNQLEVAVKEKDSKKVKEIYDKANMIDWDNVSDSLFGRYDDLIDEANYLLMS